MFSENPLHSSKVKGGFARTTRTGDPIFVFATTRLFDTDIVKSASAIGAGATSGADNVLGDLGTCALHSPGFCVGSYNGLIRLR